MVKSSIEDSDSDFGVDIEEDNIIESKPKKKSKYNGMNVTGCVEGDGTVVMASFIGSNLISKKNVKEFKLPDILSELFNQLSAKGIQVVDYGEVTNKPGTDWYVKFKTGIGQGIVMFDDSVGKFQMSYPDKYGNQIKTGTGISSILNLV